MFLTGKIAQFIVSQQDFSVGREGSETQKSVLIPLVQFRFELTPLSFQVELDTYFGTGAETGVEMIRFVRSTRRCKWSHGVIIQILEHPT